MPEFAPESTDRIHLARAAVERGPIFWLIKTDADEEEC